MKKTNEKNEDVIKSLNEVIADSKANADVAEQ